MDNGTFGPGRYYATKNYPLSVALGDLDGDGKLDIVAAGRYVEESTAIHTVDVLLGSGTGASGPRPSTRPETRRWPWPWRTSTATAGWTS